MNRLIYYYYYYIFLFSFISIFPMTDNSTNVDTLLNGITEDIKAEVMGSTAEIIKLLANIEPYKRKAIVKQFALEVKLLKKLDENQRKKLFEVIKISAKKIKKGKNPFNVLITWGGFSSYSILFLSLLYNVFNIFFKSIVTKFFFPVAIFIGVFLSYKVFKWSFEKFFGTFESFSKFFIWFFSVKMMCSFVVPATFLFALFIFGQSF